MIPGLTATTLQFAAPEKFHDHDHELHFDSFAEVPKASGRLGIPLF
jgi:hypothetical protein